METCSCHPEKPPETYGQGFWQAAVDRLTEAAATWEMAWFSEKERAQRAETSKNGAYSERNKLVAALSKLFPSSLERHDPYDANWEDDWRWIVFIDLPTGQATWHLHDSELPLFAHLPRKTGRKWDGHTNEKKYERLAALAKSQADGEKP